MNLSQNPELLDRLAASYSLGTLHGGARRRFEQLAREYPQVRAAALLWQGRWSAFSEVQTPVQPDAVVWTRIANLLQAETAKAKLARQRETASKSAWPALAWWRGLALAGGWPRWRLSRWGFGRIKGLGIPRSRNCLRYRLNSRWRRLNCRLPLKFNMLRCSPMARLMRPCW